MKAMVWSAPQPHEALPLLLSVAAAEDVCAKWGVPWPQLIEKILQMGCCSSWDVRATLNAMQWSWVRRPSLVACSQSLLSLPNDISYSQSAIVVDTFPGRCFLGVSSYSVASNKPALVRWVLRLAGRVWAHWLTPVFLLPLQTRPRVCAYRR